ncbi:MAG TPA: protein kinase, partial [Pirellulales bacterium]
NIFVDEGIVKIGDYGLSKFMSCSRRSGQTGSVGTVHYMAPEIANGRYGKEIDIYALGIILYEMLTGHVPFEGESVGEILMKHLTAEPDLTVLNEPYRTIVSRALAKDPQRRFASVGELIDLLPPVPAGAALTAAARFAGPTAAMAAASSLAVSAETADYSLAPEIAAANQADRSAQVDAQTDNRWKAMPSGNAAAPRPNEDPIARWFHDTWSDLSAWWVQKNFKPWQKLAILGGALYGGFFLIESTGGLTAQGHRGTTFGEFLLSVGICYWLYRRHQAKKLAASSGTGQPGVSAPTPGANINRAGAAKQSGEIAQAGDSGHRLRPAAILHSPTRQRWQKISSTPLYQPGPPRERITQLLGSLLLSTVICFVVGLVVMLLRGRPVDTVQYAWLAASSTLGSWAVLIPAKFWEGSRGDAALRRFVMLAMGLVIGAAAYGLMSWLMVSLHHELHFDDRSPFQLFHNEFYNAEGSPELVAFLAYFGFLFVIPRWWKQADPLRGTRLSIWCTLCVVFWSWVLTLFWGFPQPWGLMLTATVAIAVQLSSPWLSVSERAQLPRPAAGG